jgi:hypothetical protein
MAAHAIPTGEGFTGSHGAHGYPFMLDLLARPTLLVFGFFTSYVVMDMSIRFGATIITEAFNASNAAFGGTSSTTGSANPLTLVMNVVIVGMMVYFMVNRAIELITYVPKTVMRWMGSMGMGQNNGENERQLAQMVGQGGGAVGGGMKTVMAPRGGAADAAQGAFSWKFRRKDTFVNRDMPAPTGGGDGGQAGG